VNSATVAERGSREQDQPSAVLARAGALNLLARLATGAAAFALAILTTHVLDVHGRGLYAILTTTAGIAVILLTAPSPVAVADLVHGRRDEAQIRGGLIALGLFSCVVLVILAVASHAVGLRLPGGPTVQIATAITSGIIVYITCEINLAQGVGNVTWVGLGELLAALLPFIASAAAAALGYTAVGDLIFAWLLGALATALLQLGAGLRRHSVSLDGSSLPVALGWLRRSQSIALSNSALQLCARIDVLVVSAVISVSAAGIYSIPVALAGNLLLFPRSLITAMYRRIMTASPADVGRRLGVTLRGCVMLVAAGAVVGVPLTILLGGAIFGGPYSGIWEPLAILMPGIAGWAVVELLRHVLLTRYEQQREVLYTAIGMTIANGVLAVVGSELFGLDGAAASTTITYLGAAAWMTHVASRRIGIHPSVLYTPVRSDLTMIARLAKSVRGGGTAVTDEPTDAGTTPEPQPTSLRKTPGNKRTPPRAAASRTAPTRTGPLDQNDTDGTQPPARAPRTTAAARAAAKKSAEEKAAATAAAEDWLAASEAALAGPDAIVPPPPVRPAPVERAPEPEPEPEPRRVASASAPAAPPETAPAPARRPPSRSGSDRRRTAAATASTPPPPRQEMSSLTQYLRLATIPIVIGIVGAVLGFVYSQTQATLYESQSQIVVSPTSAFLDPARADAFPAITVTVQQLALTERVVDAAATTVGGGITGSDVRSSLRLSISGDTPVLTIGAVAGSQSRASQIAAAESDSLTKAVNSIRNPGLTLRVFSQSQTNGQVQPEPSRDALLGGSATFLLACFGVAYLISNRRNRSTS
jgi:O-antigen/teichoic acid export membrane protein/capsular polysaccharide biosynthesis protein